MNDPNITVHIDGYSFSDTLGPAGRNFAAVWFHGCERGCKGCIASNWNSREALFSASAGFLASLIAEEAEEKNIHIDGFVISGGEPFMQTKGVTSFLKAAAGELGYRPDVMIYTGYKLDELRSLAETDPDIGDLISEADIIVDGEYIEELDCNSPYAGSTNQIIHFLSERYSERDLPEKERRTQISFDRSEVRMTGIPSSGAKKLWNDIKEILAAP